jgi:hypothetical protein
MVGSYLIFFGIFKSFTSEEDTDTVAPSKPPTGITVGGKAATNPTVNTTTNPAYNDPPDTVVVDITPTEPEKPYEEPTMVPAVQPTMPAKGAPKEEIAAFWKYGP